MSRRLVVSVLCLCGPVAMAAGPAVPPGSGGVVGAIPGPPSSVQTPPSVGGVPLTGLPQVVLGPGGYPLPGAVIDDSNNDYFPLTDRLLVGGEVRGLPNPAGWTVSLQGVPQALAVGPNGKVEFGRQIELAANQGPGVPFAGWLDDKNRPLIGVLAELIDPNGDVVDRDRIVYYDTRNEPDMHPYTPTGDRIDGLGMQVSQTGATALADVHLATLYYPSPGHFQADVDAAVAAWPAETTELGELCTELTLGHPVTLTTAYAGAYAEAVATFSLYEASANLADACLAAAAIPGLGTAIAAACATGAGLSRESLCVKSLPDPTGFKVCTSGIRLEATAMTVGHVEAQGLAFGAGGTLISTPTVGDLHTDWVGTLEGLRVEWDRDGFCTGLPAADLSESDLEQAAVVDWRTCDDLVIDASSATGDLTYALDAVGETVDVTWSSGEFDAFPDSDSEGTGACAEDWVVGLTNFALLVHHGDLGEILTDAWTADAPINDESLALDLLLSPLEIGLQTPRLATPELEWSDLRTDEADGLWLAATTDASPAFAGKTEPSAWFQYVADPPPEWFADGVDPDLEPFDVAVSLTTGWLNQVVRAAYGTGRLDDEALRITRGDMGASTNTTQVVQLDGTLLAAHVDPLFAEIGASNVTLTIDGSWTPFTLMERDPPNTDMGDWKVSYNGPAFYVTLSSGADVWAAFAVDLHEDDLLPSWDTGTQTVAFPLTNPEMTWTVVQWNFATCKPRPFGIAPTCETDAVGGLAEIANPAIRRLLQSLIREVPAPRYFNSAGASAARRDITSTATGTWRENQTITILGDLE